MIDLTDAAFWARPDAPQIIDGMRALAPVQRQTTAQGEIWSVLSYRESVAALTDPALSSRGGSLLGSAGNAPPAGSGRMMALCDKPRHRKLREPVIPFFGPKYVNRMRGPVRDLAASVIDACLEKETIDIVPDLSAVVPFTVMCDLMGVPRQDRDLVVGHCDRAFLAESEADRRGGHQQLISYLFGLAMRRRTDPGEDIISAFAQLRVDGEPLPLEDVLLNCDNIIVGGVQTVRHTVAMAVKALIDHPQVWQRLRHPETDLDTAVEELMRWTSVGLHTMRTATRDTTIGGEHVAPGERVVVWVPAANHDSAVFPEPHTLLLDRRPNRHLAFGWGDHYCVGAGLARLEIREVLGRLAQRVARLEPVSEPKPNHSIINFGLDSLRVRLWPA